MNDGLEIGDAFLFFNGEKIMDVTPIEIKVDLAESVTLNDTKELRFANRSYSGTFKNVEISDEFKGLVLDTTQTYTVIAESYNFPRGNKLPKKKRIRSKWMKKYYRKIELENVYIN